MTQLPFWAQYVEVLGPSFVALVAGLFGSYIAYRHWRTGHYRLRLDMFEKRYAVYEAIKSLIGTAELHKQITSEDVGELYDGVRGAEFLFDGATRTFIKKIGDMVFRARMARAALSKEHPRADRLIAEEKDVLTFLRDQDAALEKTFSQYIDLSTLGV
jgi:hypothetical protein